MAYTLKKDHLTNWNRQETNEKPLFNDDQDSYISERSSAASLNETTPSPIPINKQLPSRLPPPPPIPRKEPHSLRYYYNELPENGIPLATQFKEAQKEEKQRKKNPHKAPTGQGTLVELPEKPRERGDNYYPYWYYYKLKNPDWIMRHRQTADGQLIPYDYVNPSQYVHEPALSTSPSKTPRQHHRKSRYDPSNMPYNPDKKPYETVQKETLLPPKQYVPLKGVNNGERSDQPTGQIRLPQREKLKTENDWNNHYIQSVTMDKSSQDANNLNGISNTSKHHHHHHHHSKTMHNILPNENKNHRHIHHHHSSPPQLSQPHHHHHHHLPSKEYVDNEFQVIDASFKKSERTPYFQQTSNSFHLPPPAIYDQNSYLPPITHDYYYRLNPSDYYYKPIPTDYTTQTFNKDRKEPIKSPKIHRADQQTNFYDRYLNNIITKKITE
jgi:hypothetical protein